jgi:hypothetical protein
LKIVKLSNIQIPETTSSNAPSSINAWKIVSTQKSLLHLSVNNIYFLAEFFLQLKKHASKFIQHTMVVFVIDSTNKGTISRISATFLDLR